MEKEQLSPADLADLIAHSKCYVIDVRSAREYERYHIKGAYNINIDDLSWDNLLQTLNIKNEDDVSVVTYCNAGGRGGRAFLMLKNQKPQGANIKVKNLQHGINAWIDAGHKIQEIIL
jgi:rhodanese-related sulfurtransferase